MHVSLFVLQAGHAWSLSSVPTVLHAALNAAAADDDAAAAGNASGRWKASTLLHCQCHQVRREKEVQLHNMFVAYSHPWARTTATAAATEMCQCHQMCGDADAAAVYHSCRLTARCRAAQQQQQQQRRRQAAPKMLHMNTFMSNLQVNLSKQGSYPSMAPSLSDRQVRHQQKHASSSVLHLSSTGNCSINCTMLAPLCCMAYRQGWPRAAGPGAAVEGRHASMLPCAAS
jgi:hypothetical protein